MKECSLLQNGTEDDARRPRGQGDRDLPPDHSRSGTGQCTNWESPQDWPAWRPVA